MYRHAFAKPWVLTYSAYVCILSGEPSVSWRRRCTRHLDSHLLPRSSTLDDLLQEVSTQSLSPLPPSLSLSLSLSFSISLSSSLFDTHAWPSYACMHAYLNSFYTSPYLTPIHSHTHIPCIHTIHSDLQKLEREARICRMMKHGNIGRLSTIIMYMYVIRDLFRGWSTSPEVDSTP